MQSSNRSLQLWRECCRISKSESKIRSGRSAKSSSTPFTLSSQIIWTKWTPIRFAVSSNERSTSESKCDDGRFLHALMYWWKVVFNVDSQFPSPIVLEQNQTTDTRSHHQIRRDVRRFSSVLRRFQRRNKKSLLRTAERSPDRWMQFRWGGGLSVSVVLRAVAETERFFGIGGFGFYDERPASNVHFGLEEVRIQCKGWL